MTLLLDALDRSLKEPQCAPRWRNLMAIWLEAGDKTAQRSVLDMLEAMPASEPRADILRLTFLAGATGDSRFENAAATQVLAVEPRDPDRLAAFMAFQWLSALQYLESRADFTTALSAAQVPEMAGRLMQDASRTIPSGFLPRAPNDIQRIAVVVPYVGHQFHTPSVMAVEQCAVLAREGRQVRLFSAQELTPPDAPLFRGDGRDLKLPPLNAQAWQSLLPAGVGMTISDSRFSLEGRWRKLMPILAGFDPDVVLLVGLYSPLAAALQTVRPVVGISVNTVPPIAPVDVWLTGDASLAGRDTWSANFPPPLPVFHPWRVKRSKQPSHVTRVELGLSDDAVIWITAGFRLEHEIKGEWADRMVQLLARHPRVVWLLIGGEGRLAPALLHEKSGRVRALATRSDIPGVLRCADIYVNPPRMGGGFSVAEAMAEGLPVTSFAGSDGGDKVGDLALPDMDAYLERLAALTENPTLRRDMGEVLRKRFAERFDIEASGPALVSACVQAAALAKGRLIAPS